MKIESIHIKNFKVFKDTKITNLEPLSVFLGTNGSGKTTLFKVFEFLGNALRDNATIAIANKGGIKEVLSRGCEVGKDEMYFEIKFRAPDLFPKSSNPLITYELRIGFDAKTNKAIITREVLKYRRGNRGLPWHFLDFSKGSGKAITNESEYQDPNAKQQRIDQALKSPDILAIKGLGQFNDFKVVSQFREILENWHISNLAIANARSSGNVAHHEHLSATGDNLAQVTQYLFEYHRDIFDLILKKLPKRIPGINQVEAKITEEGRVLLKFQDENFKDPFVSAFVSDGTIKMFALMVLLHDPSPHPLLCIEEPENFLHPDLLYGLAKEVRDYAYKGGQVFVSTHSPDFLNAIDIEELFFLQKEKGFSNIKKASEDKFAKSLSEHNALGWLWQHRYIKGANLE